MLIIPYKGRLRDSEKCSDVLEVTLLDSGRTSRSNSATAQKSCKSPFTSILSQGDLCYPEDIGQYLEIILVVTVGLGGVIGTRWVEARDLAPTLGRPAPTSKN